MTEIPLLRDLQVLQLEQYWVGRYIKWTVNHWFDFKKLNKTKLKWTFKIKLLTLGYLFFLGLVYWLVVKYFSLVAGLIGFVAFIIWPIFVLVPVTLVVKFWEDSIVDMWIDKTRAKLKKLKDLTIVGITGSWGKSSVKHYLSKILDQVDYTVTTPGSYNTTLGVIKVVKMEIIDKVKYFVVEMGAFARGDIKKIARMVKPEYGILTAVGKQHLDRFGSIKKVKLTKFELVDEVKDKSKVLVNWDNEEIREWVEKNKKYKEVRKYSLSDKSADFVADKIKIKKDGMSFEVVHKNNRMKFETRLFGTVNVENMLVAVAMAIMLGVDKKIIQKGVMDIRPVKNRLELKKIGKATIVDNTYSSNEAGFRTLLNDLSKLEGKKVLVTPGIVELGKLTKSIHQRLGRIVGDMFDEVVLVGESERTRSLQVGIGKARAKTKVWFMEEFSNYWPTVYKLSEKYDWVVLENDLPENYN